MPSGRLRAANILTFLRGEDLQDENNFLKAAVIFENVAVDILIRVWIPETIGDNSILTLSHHSS